MSSRDRNPKILILASEYTRLITEYERLAAFINTPETHDFLKGVELEIAHQRNKWSDDHDAKKTAGDWMWTCGYLANKALTADLAGNFEKARHHAITVSALMGQYHRNLTAREQAEAEPLLKGAAE